MDARPPPRTDPAASARLLRARAQRGEHWIDVSGRSMMPTIPPSGRVLVVPAAKPRRGQVWAYVGESGEVIVHRFERRSGTLLLFRGDGGQHYDPPVTRDRLIGRVRGARVGERERRLGALDQFRGVARSTARRVRQQLRRAQ